MEIPREYGWFFDITMSEFTERLRSLGIDPGSDVLTADRME